MKRLLFVMFTVLCVSCNTKYLALKKYYSENKQLHKILADSLSNFVADNNTEVILKKRPDLGDQIIFRIYIKRNRTRTPILYDSLLNRTDPYPESTSNISVPIEIIKLFKSLKYTSLIATTNDGVFFGDEYDLNGNSQIGIIINRGEEKKKEEYIIRLDKNIYITRNIIP